MSNTINNANEVQVFNNANFGQVRSMMIDGEPWFVGKDITSILGYKDTADALKKHIDSEDKLTRRFADSGQHREMIIINESGLYSLIMSSKLPKAKEFKRWVTSEVLPTIRKTGSYGKLKELSAPQTLDDTLNADVLFLIASKWKADSDKRKELEVRVAELEAQIKTQQVQPVISEATKVAIKEAKVEQHRLYTVSEIARECGFPDARTLNLALNDLGIQYKVKSHWQLAKEYEELGYAMIVSPYANTPFLKWTLKGKEFIRQQLKEAHLL